MIEPSNGRIVWFTPNRQDIEAGMVQHDIKPLAAMVCHVWGPRMVNVLVTDGNGHQHRRTSVVLLQDDDPKPDGQHFAAWMPYQKGQAAKTEAAEAKLTKDPADLV